PKLLAVPAIIIEKSLKLLGGARTWSDLVDHWLSTQTSSWLPGGLRGSIREQASAIWFVCRTSDPRDQNFKILPSCRPKLGCAINLIESAWLGTREAAMRHRRCCATAKCIGAVPITGLRPPVTGLLSSF